MTSSIQRERTSDLGNSAHIVIEIDEPLSKIELICRIFVVWLVVVRISPIVLCNRKALSYVLLVVIWVYELYPERRDF